MRSFRGGGKSSYLAGVDVAVVDAGDDESLAGDVDALSVCLVDSGGLALGDVGEVLHLLGADLFAIPCQLAASSPRAFCRDRCEGASSLGGGHITWPHSRKWRGKCRTVKPEVVAQALSPAVLMIAPLST